MKRFNNRLIQLSNDYSENEINNNIYELKSIKYINPDNIVGKKYSVLHLIDNISTALPFQDDDYQIHIDFYYAQFGISAVITKEIFIDRLIYNKDTSQSFNLDYTITTNNDKTSDFYYQKRELILPDILQPYNYVKIVFHNYLLYRGATPNISIEKSYEHKLIFFEDTDF